VNCPDIEQITGGATDGTAPDIQAHLRECADCRAAARFVGELRAAYETALPVSEASIQRAVLRERATVTSGPVVWDLVTMAALGGVTCTLALALSGGLSGHPLV
jgi:predicted anti-sigma-YlaC factor YlaD